MAVSLSTVTFADGHGVAIARNGVVTPNHPDMVWLMQSAAVPGPEPASLPHASRRPKLHFTRR